MPLVWILFATFVGTYIVKIVFRVFAAIGIGIIVYKVGSQFVVTMSQQIQGQFGGLPSDALALLGIMKIDIAITMILSAYVTKFVLNCFKWVKK